jgi:DNA processing protein
MHQVEGIGAATMLRLARTFGSPAAAVQADPAALMSRGRLSAVQAEQMSAVRANLDALQEAISAMQERGISLCALGDPCYPGGLLALRNPPPLLYLRGDLRPDDERAVAIVGTREPTREGAWLAKWLARQLAERGITIVSGLARGIDTAGHRGALAAAQGRTIAVLGCGVLRLHPPENGVLAAQIARRGCLAGEIPPDREVERRFLLARDRIQAALSRAVIVAQAHRECGSMVTARHAVRCRRLLYAVPWTEEPFAEGWQRLQRLGARPVMRGTDLEALVAEIDATPRPSPQQSLG